MTILVIGVTSLKIRFMVAWDTHINSLFNLGKGKHHRRKSCPLCNRSERGNLLYEPSILELSNNVNIITNSVKYSRLKGYPV